MSKYITVADTKFGVKLAAAIVWDEPTIFGGKLIVFGPGPSMTLMTAEELLEREGLKPKGLANVKFWEVVEGLRKKGESIEYAPSVSSFTRRAVQGHARIKEIANNIVKGDVS